MRLWGKVLEIQKVNAKAVAKYALLPGIIPRIRSFTSSGFGYLAHLMALIYHSTRLLPAGHPYLNPTNIGKFGIRHVITEAAERLVLKKENTDQIIIFFALIVGFLILLAQIVFLVGGFIIAPALADTGGGYSFMGYFATPEPENDVAFMLLDKVFAIPGLYGSKFSPAAGAIPAFNQGLQELFRFYSLAILLIGVIIFLYYIVLLVGESAQSGTPFGRRFNHVWAPLRLVVAIGLLIPMNYGLNTAQYITLYAAKMGSGFATNAWILYNDSLSNALGIQDESIIARPKAPDIYPTVQFMNLVLTCSYGYEYARPDNLVLTESGSYDTSSETPPAIRYTASSGGSSAPEEIDQTISGGGSDGSGGSGVIQPYFVKQADAMAAGESLHESMLAGDYAEAKEFYNGENILIRFGHKDEEINQNVKGFVEPYCGEIEIPAVATESEVSDIIQEAYYNLVMELWQNETYRSYAKRVVAMSMSVDKVDGDSAKPVTGCHVQVAEVGGADVLNGSACKDEAEKEEGEPNILPNSVWKNSSYTSLQSEVAAALLNDSGSAYNKMKEILQESEEFKVSDELKARGWGGAGIWYNKIAEWNGTLFSAVMAGPNVTRMPAVMNRLKEEVQASNENSTPDSVYSLELSNGEEIQFNNNVLKEIAQALVTTYQDWVVSGQVSSATEQKSGNIIKDMIGSLFGISSLYSMREDVQTHPLAQLSALGKGIMDAAVRNLLTSLAFSFGGGIAETAKEGGLQGIGEGVSQMFSAFTTIGLTIGFMLYYILPFLPFLYFFFAVGQWIKTIFEAMVAVPLWALAHLRIDGNGLPGETAANGYYLIFEIFLRPILCVFGLLSGMAIFSATVRTLNDVFTLVTDNVAGFECLASDTADACTGGETGDAAALQAKNRRNEIDEFFFTIIYTVLVYMIATASFKMIDLIPNGIIRWIGSGAQSFADQAPDAKEGLMQYAAIGGNTVSGQAVQAANQGARAAGNVVGTPFGLFNRNANSNLGGER